MSVRPYALFSKVFYYDSTLRDMVLFYLDTNYTSLEVHVNSYFFSQNMLII